MPARRWAVSLDTAAGSVIGHSSRGGDRGIQLLKQLNGDRGAPREREGGFKTLCPLSGKALSSELLEGGEEGARAPIARGADPAQLGTEQGCLRMEGADRLIGPPAE